MLSRISLLLFVRLVLTEVFTSCLLSCFYSASCFSIPLELVFSCLVLFGFVFQAFKPKNVNQHNYLQ